MSGVGDGDFFPIPLPAPLPTPLPYPRRFISGPGGVEVVTGGGEGSGVTDIVSNSAEEGVAAMGVAAAAFAVACCDVMWVPAATAAVADLVARAALVWSLSLPMSPYGVPVSRTCTHTLVNKPTFTIINTSSLLIYTII